MYRKHQLAQRIELDPAGAAREVAAEYRRAKCSRQDAAKSLGVSPGTFIRWVKILDAKGAGLSATLGRLKRQARREGWDRGGRLEGEKLPAKVKRKAKPKAKVAA